MRVLGTRRAPKALRDLHENIALCKRITYSLLCGGARYKIPEIPIERGGVRRPSLLGFLGFLFLLIPYLLYSYRLGDPYFYGAVTPPHKNMDVLSTMASTIPGEE
jgi:hypothetical protein